MVKKAKFVVGPSAEHTQVPPLDYRYCLSGGVISIFHLLKIAMERYVGDTYYKRANGPGH